jgi:hypothetical protein
MGGQLEGGKVIMNYAKDPMLYLNNKAELLNSAKKFT